MMTVTGFEGHPRKAWYMKHLKRYMGLNPLVWHGLEEVSWRNIFKMCWAKKIVAYNDVSGEQAAACFRLGCTSTSLVHNQEHAMFLIKQMDEVVVPFCMQLSDHSSFQGAEAQGMLQKFFPSVPAKLDQKVGDSDARKKAQSESGSDGESFCSGEGAGD